MKDGKEVVREITENLHVLPNNLSINGDIKPERRYRGIHEVVVYNSKIKIGGNFSDLNINEMGVDSSSILWDKAFVTVGLNDLRGIKDQVSLKWNDDFNLFNPGVKSNDLVKSGIHTPVKLSQDSKTKYNFSCELTLKGSQYLYFAPVGKETNINMVSSWNTPSFNGSFLPENHSVSDKWFEAEWKVLNLNRNFPQFWTGSKYNLNESTFGVDLILPVDNYHKSYRSIQYAILFIGFTFISFFFIEVMNKVFIHPVQYVLVGIALVVFYTLLLSLSEHMRYNAAFITSAIATILLITGYVKAIFKSFRLTFFISTLLLILYTFIFIIIQMEELALLIGSIGVFMILATSMYFSRKIDWYELGNGDKKDVQPFVE